MRFTWSRWISLIAFPAIVAAQSWSHDYWIHPRIPLFPEQNVLQLDNQVGASIVPDCSGPPDDFIRITHSFETGELVVKVERIAPTFRSVLQCWMMAGRVSCPAPVDTSQLTWVPVEGVEVGGVGLGLTFAIAQGDLTWNEPNPSACSLLP